MSGKKKAAHQGGLEQHREEKRRLVLGCSICCIKDLNGREECSRAGQQRFEKRVARKKVRIETKSDDVRVQRRHMRNRLCTGVISRKHKTRGCPAKLRDVAAVGGGTR